MWRVWKTRSTRNLVYMPRQHLGAGKLTSWLEWSRAISMMTLWTWQRNSRRCCCGTLAFCRRVAPKFVVGNVGQRCQQLLLLLVVMASPQMMLCNVLSVGRAVDTSCNWEMLASHGRHFGQVSPVATLRSSTCSYAFFSLSLLLVLAILFPAVWCASHYRESGAVRPRHEMDIMATSLLSSFCSSFRFRSYCSAQLQVRIPLDSMMHLAPSRNHPIGERLVTKWRSMIFFALAYAESGNQCLM